MIGTAAPNRLAQLLALPQFYQDGGNALRRAMMPNGFADYSQQASMPVVGSSQDGNYMSSPGNYMSSLSGYLADPQGYASGISSSNWILAQQRKGVF
jgi:hypothetical protein